MSQSRGPDLPEISDRHYWHLPRMIIAWAAAATVGILVTVLVPSEQRFAWLVFAVGLSTLITFALQLGTAQREGFITRCSFSVAGAVVVIAIIDVAGFLLN